MVNFKGDKVTVKLPSPIPSGYDIPTNQGWLKLIKSLQGTVVTLEHWSISAIGVLQISGWQVRVASSTPSSGAIYTWLPDGWFELLDTSPKIQTQTVAPSAGIGYCVACGGVSKHRLMCPKENK